MQCSFVFEIIILINELFSVQSEDRSDFLNKKKSTNLTRVQVGAVKPAVSKLVAKGRTTYDKAVYHCQSCQSYLSHDSSSTVSEPSSFWTQIKFTIQQSRNSKEHLQRAVQDLNFDPKARNNQSQLQMRNPLFFFQSPCSVAQLDSTGGPVLKQVACESNQKFECQRNSGSGQSLDDKTFPGTCKMRDVCWSNIPDNPKPGCRHKPVPGTLYFTPDFFGERIINGHNAIIEDNPWAVFLYVTKEENFWSCGASIIGEYLILTARHCVINDVDLRHYKWQILVGQVDKRRLPPSLEETDYNFILHPNKSVDIALIKLREPLVFSDRVSPISLPHSTSQSPEVGEWVTAIGWGVYIQESEDKTYTSDFLQTVDIQVTGNDCFQDKQDVPEEKKSFLFCAGGPTPSGRSGQKVNKDTCTGDSGGSLVCTDKNKKYVCGVTSLGPRPPHCAKSSGGYVRVFHPDILPFLERELEQQTHWTEGIGGPLPKPRKHRKDTPSRANKNKRGGSKMSGSNTWEIETSNLLFSILLFIILTGPSLLC